MKDCCAVGLKDIFKCSLVNRIHYPNTSVYFRHASSHQFPSDKILPGMFDLKSCPTISQPSNYVMIEGVVPYVKHNCLFLTLHTTEGKQIKKQMFFEYLRCSPIKLQQNEERLWRKSSLTSHSWNYCILEEQVGKKKGLLQRWFITFLLSIHIFLYFFQDMYLQMAEAVRDLTFT